MEICLVQFEEDKFGAKLIDVCTAMDVKNTKTPTPLTVNKNNLKLVCAKSFL